MRKIPKKNYVILCVMAIAVVAICFILMNLYNSYNKVEYKSEMKSTINEIKSNELDSFIEENPDVVIYINDSSIDNNELDKQIKDLITKNNIVSYFVYLEKNKDVINKFKIKDNNPIFIIYKDGKIKEKYSKETYTIDEIESLLVRNEVIEND